MRGSREVKGGKPSGCEAVDVNQSMGMTTGALHGWRELIEFKYREDESERKQPHARV